MIRAIIGFGWSILWVILAIGCSENAPEPERSFTRLARGNNRPAVEIRKEGAGYMIYRHGEPFWVKGASGTEQPELLKLAGGNTFRTYVADGLDTLLDKAESLGLAVMAGIWLETESEGFDYSDPEQLSAQRERVIQIVKKYKDHPALLCWDVGNEVIQFSENAVTIAKTIGQLAQLIHQVDPEHPVTTSCIIGNVELLLENAVHLDFISVNAFGALGSTINALKTEIMAPFLITEWGVNGYWESQRTIWNSPREYYSLQKAEVLRSRYGFIDEAKELNCLGSFVFFWGQKQEMTHSWFSLFLENGAKTPEVDVLNQLWGGTPLKDKAPLIHEVHLDKPPGSIFVNDTIKLRADAEDPENGALTYQWEITSDGRKFKYIPHKVEIRPDPIPGLFVSQTGNELVFRAPPQHGTYRIFVSVFDPAGNGAIYNIPILVQNNSLIYTSGSMDPT